MSVGGTSGSGTGGWGCFVAGTKIATPSGVTPIEALEVGDLVLAYDERSARVVPRQVTATFVHANHTIGALTTKDGRTLRVTANHPIYLPDEGRYTNAGQLRGDERLLGLHHTAVTSMISAGYAETAGDLATVYNISVAGEENYFAEGVLVHNKSGAGPVSGCQSVSWSGVCTALEGCLDPAVPMSESVTLNQRRPVDAGVADAPFDSGGLVDGAADAIAPEPSPDGGRIRVPAIETALCGAAEPGRGVNLAFDVWSDAEEPAVAIYASETGSCNGSQLGEAWLFDGQPAPRSAWTTQCVRLYFQSYHRRFALVPTSASTYVENPRFVSNCSCRRVLKIRTVCGVDDSRAALDCL